MLSTVLLVCLACLVQTAPQLNVQRQKRQQPGDEKPHCRDFHEDGFHCVPYWQCNDEYRIKIGGVGIFDPRAPDCEFGDQDCCPPDFDTVLNSQCDKQLEVCCLHPDSSEQYELEFCKPEYHFTNEPDDESNPVCDDPIFGCAPNKPRGPRVLPKLNCGRRNDNGAGPVSSTPKAGEAEFGEWPHVCAVLKLERIGNDPNEPLKVYHCGASLLDEGIVLTAAHCVHNIDAADLLVRCGEWDTQNVNTDQPIQEHQVRDVKSHPDFTNDVHFNNFAILFMETNFTISEHISPVCLPNPCVEYAPQNCVANGWGKNKFGAEGRFSTILKEIIYPMVDRKQCQTDLRKTRLGQYFELDDSFLCAGGEKGVDTCKGDGGAPLTCRIPENNNWVQAGIVSWGIGCGETGTPAVYANVAKASCWIDNEARKYYKGSETYFGFLPVDCNGPNPGTCDKESSTTPRFRTPAPTPAPTPDPIFDTDIDTDATIFDPEDDIFDSEDPEDPQEPEYGNSEDEIFDVVYPEDDRSDPKDPVDGISDPEDPEDSIFDPVSPPATPAPDPVSSGERLQCSSLGEDGFHCVPYWQCNENYHIKTGGAGLFDVRAPDCDSEADYEEDCCPPDKDTALNSQCDKQLEVCCLHPDSAGQYNKSNLATCQSGSPAPSPPPPACNPDNQFGCPTVGNPVPLKCGIRNADGAGPVSSIPQAGDAEFGEWPHVCAVLKKERIGNNPSQPLIVYHCGASLLDEGIVLTAAHCVHNIDAADLLVRCGEWDTQNVNTDMPYQELQVRDIKSHPDFNDEVHFNNFAILFMDTDFILTNYISPICLPNPCVEYATQNCVANGWGKDKFGNEGRFQTILKEIVYPMINNAQCQKDLRKTRLSEYFILDDSFLCAGGEKGVDTCKGDGGGPLTCRIPESNNWVQAGIVSWGIGCGETGTPAVYANVAKASCWIDDEVKKYYKGNESYFGFLPVDCNGPNPAKCSKETPGAFAVDSLTDTRSNFEDLFQLRGEPSPGKK